jgi:hypothetical protein
MQAILLYLCRLCLLRESPARIPPSLSLAVFTTGLYFLTGMASFALSRDSLAFSTIVGVSFLSLSIESAGLYGLLYFKSYQHRFLASLIAIFACNSMFLIALLPVNYLLSTLDTGLAADFVNTLSLLSLFWWLAIVGFILRQAAEISIFQGIVLAFVIELLVAISIRSLFSEFS